MQEHNTEIIKFTEAFFKNLKSEIAWEGELLVVTKVPIDFENFSSKKAPYYLAFSPTTLPHAEFISKGSLLLNAMTNYLQKRGETTLLKINFERDYKEEFQHYLKLKACVLYSFTKKVEYKTLVRFTFSTSLQYLNEREQVTNAICTKEGKITNLILEKYKVEEGKKEELPTYDMKKDFEAAKEEVKNLLQRKLEETKESLKKRLDKELQRIQEHYKQQEKELAVQLQRLIEQQLNLEKQFVKATVEEKKTLEAKQEKLKESIQLLSQPSQKEKIKKEESFFITDETYKHSLNINNQLLNTTIIYYPIFTFTLVIKSPESARQIELTYNPLEEILTPITCDTCKREITQLSICSSGHVSCQNCLQVCRECLRALCMSCTKKECSYCGIRICKKCGLKCTSCLKIVCGIHTKKDYLTGKDLCTNCSLRCDRCGKYTSKTYIKKTSSGLWCTNCAARHSLKETTSAS